MSTAVVPVGRQCPARPDVGRKGLKVPLRANHFAMKISDGYIHHYDVDITPQKLPKKLNREVFHQMIKENPKQFGKVKPVFDGNKNMYCMKELDLDGDTWKFEVLIPEPGRKVDRPFKVAVKWAATVNLCELQQMLTGRHVQLPQSAIQALDVVLRHSPSVRYTQVGRSFFSPSEAPPALGGGREMWFGYYQSVRPVSKQMVVNVDVSATAFYKAQPVMSFMQDFFEDRNFPQRNRPLTDNQRVKFKREIKGLRVEITHCGEKKRKYRVCDVTHRPAHSQTFPLMGTNGKETECTVANYFKQMYKKSLQYPYLPCLHVGQPTSHTYLPVEVCNIVAGQRCNKKLTDTQMANFMKAMPKSAPERANQIIKLVNDANYRRDEYVKEFQIDVNPQMMAVPGRILQPPGIMHGQKSLAVPRDGVWDMRGKKFYQGMKVSKWALLCFDSYVRDEELNVFSKELRSMADRMGMPFEEAGYTARISNAKQLQDTFRQFESARPKPQLIVAVLPLKSDVYAKIKQAGDVMFGLMTQCILAKNVKRVSPQTIANLCLKINAKMSGVNWVLDPKVRLPVMNEPVLFIGADVTHPAPGETTQPSIAAVVGSHDVCCMRYVAVVRAQMHRKEVIVDLTSMVTVLLKQFRESTKKVPKRIIFYRDGVSEGQFREVLFEEVEKVRTACRGLSPTYAPAMTFVVVQKRHHTRLFCELAKDQKGKSCNIAAGSVVDTVITHPSEFDFYLCSHAGILGTSRPTHYHVLLDDNHFTSDDLQQLTYQLCHLYARCTRAVSLPAPVYYAHLVAFRARYHMAKDGDGTSVMSSGSSEMSISDVQNAVTVHPDIMPTMYFA